MIFWLSKESCTASSYRLLRFYAAAIAVLILEIIKSCQTLHHIIIIFVSSGSGGDALILDRDGGWCREQKGVKNITYIVQVLM